MRRFDTEQALAALELEQRLIDYWDEIDMRAGRDAAGFYEVDCTAIIGPRTIEGSEGIAAYYADRAARSIDRNGASRLGRHCFSNLCISFEEGGTVALHFTLVSYAGFGLPPILAGTAPVSVSAGAIQCRRDAAGDWRFAHYEVTPLIVAAEQFAQRAETALAGQKP